MTEEAARTIAGYLSATMLLLLIGYVIGYFVCLWRYQPSPERSTAELPEWLELSRIELARGTVVMPEVEVPDDWEPPPMLPGD